MDAPCALPLPGRTPTLNQALGRRAPRRVALSASACRSPDLLLLDERTNHRRRLWFVAWALEALFFSLHDYPGTVPSAVTHDRYFSSTTSPAGFLEGSIRGPPGIPWEGQLFVRG